MSLKRLINYHRKIFHSFNLKEIYIDSHLSSWRFPCHISVSETKYMDLKRDINKF